MGARETGGIDGGYRNHLSSRVGEVDHLLQENIKVDRSDPLEEFLEGGEVGYLIQFEELGNPGHHLQEIHDTPVIHPQNLFQQDQGQMLVLGVGSSGVFTGIPGNPGAPDHR